MAEENKENEKGSAVITAIVESFTGLIGLRKDETKFYFSVASLVQTILAMGLGVLGTFLVLKFAMKKI